MDEQHECKFEVQFVRFSPACVGVVFSVRSGCLYINSGSRKGHNSDLCALSLWYIYPAAELDWITVRFYFAFLGKPIHCSCGKACVGLN